MEKYFDLVLELLELEEKEKLKDTALKLKNHQENWASIAFFHQYDFLFKAWLLLCAEKISEEDFVQIGDVDSQFQLFDENRKNAEEYFSSLKKNSFEEDVFVVDQDAWDLFLTEKEQNEILEKLNSTSKKLYLI